MKTLDIVVCRAAYAPTPSARFSRTKFFSDLKENIVVNALKLRKQ